MGFIALITLVLVFTRAQIFNGLVSGLKIFTRFFPNGILKTKLFGLIPGKTF